MRSLLLELEPTQPAAGAAVPPGVRRHVPSWPAQTALDMEVSRCVGGSVGVPQQEASCLAHKDHLSRAHDLFTFWFFEARDSGVCGLHMRPDASAGCRCEIESEHHCPASSLPRSQSQFSRRTCFEVGDFGLWNLLYSPKNSTEQEAAGVGRMGI